MNFADLMREADPARTVTAATPQCREEILDAAISSHVPRTRRGAGRIAAAVAVAASLAVGGFAVQGLLGDPAEARADEVLAEAAINAVDPPTAPGQYWEITSTLIGITVYCAPETTSSVDCTDAYISRRPHITYVEVDGAAPSWVVEGPEELVEALDPAGRMAPSERRVWTGDLTPNDFPGGWQTPSPAWLAQLPRDPQALRDRLYQDSRGTDEGAFTYAADLLRSGRVPADLRSALFTVLSDIPGVRLVDEAAVIDGRTGVAIQLDSGAGTRQLIIDPEIGQLIGERDRPSEDPYADRNLGTSYTRVLVDEVPADVVAEAEHIECYIADDNATNCPF